MIDTKTIRTQQEIIAKRNMTLPKKWILGIDAGFSSLKGFAPNKYFCFPSFAHKLDSELQIVNEKDILYRDESGTWNKRAKPDPASLHGRVKSRL